MEQYVLTALADIMARGHAIIIEGAACAATNPVKSAQLRKRLYYWGHKLAVLAPRTGNPFYPLLAEAWISFSCSPSIAWPAIPSQLERKAS